jgi:hypothetical protein
MASVYTVNKPVVFRGLKAQYIWWLGGGLMVLMIVYAIMYICSVNTFISLGVIIAMGSFLVAYVYKLSHKYGEFGMMKKMARRNIPRVVKVYSRKVFLRLKK